MKWWQILLIILAVTSPLIRLLIRSRGWVRFVGFLLAVTSPLIRLLKRSRGGVSRSSNPSSPIPAVSTTHSGSPGEPDGTTHSSGEVHRDTAKSSGSSWKGFVGFLKVLIVLGLVGVLVSLVFGKVAQSCANWRAQERLTAEHKIAVDAHPDSWLWRLGDTTILATRETMSSGEIVLKWYSGAYGGIHITAVSKPGIDGYWKATGRDIGRCFKVLDDDGQVVHSEFDQINFSKGILERANFVFVRSNQRNWNR